VGATGPEVGGGGRGREGRGARGDGVREDSTFWKKQTASGHALVVGGVSEGQPPRGCLQEGGACGTKRPHVRQTGTRKTERTSDDK
jgi:hypothetical protein